jgi:hypothetical protein
VPPGSSILRSDGSPDSQAGGRTALMVTKTLKGELENNSRKQRDLLKTGKATAEKELIFSFLGLTSMMLLMMMIR